MTQQSQPVSAHILSKAASLRRCARAALSAFAVTAMMTASPAASPENSLITGVNGPAKWLHNYAQGRQLARDLGLPLIVHFHASWCGPCVQMDRETLSSRQLVGQFGRKVIGVKIDSDEQPGLVEAFRVEGLPCDIVISPDGLIVARTSGYQPRSEYMAMVSRMNGRFRDERAAAIARLQAPARSQPDTKNDQPVTRPDQGSAGPDKRNLASNSSPRRPDSRQAPPNVQQPSTSRPVQPPQTAGSPLVGLDGYCPIHIKMKRQWIKGRPEFATTWQGVVYQFPTQADLQTFQASPQKFAPRMLGCDPVQLWLTERAVQGSVEFGAFFNGDLFLFVNAESRNQFKVNPNRYVQLRHAFRSDDVIGTRLR